MSVTSLSASFPLDMISAVAVAVADEDVDADADEDVDAGADEDVDAGADTDADPASVLFSVNSIKISSRSAFSKVISSNTFPLAAKAEKIARETA